LRIAEAGELVGLSRSAAYRAAADGGLPCITLGGTRYVPTAILMTAYGLPVPPRPANRPRIF